MTSPAMKLLGAKTAAAVGGGTWDTAATTLGSTGTTVSGTTIVITSGAAAAIGDIVIVRAAWDNDAGSYSPTATVADSNSNTWTLLGSGFYGGIPAAAGVCAAIFGSVLTTAIASSDTITVTLSGAVLAKTGFAHKFTGGLTITESRTEVVVGGATATPSSGATTGHASGDLIVCMNGIERRNDAGPTFDADTTEGSWQTGEFLRAGGGGTADMIVACQHKVTTGTAAQTWDLTWPNAGDNVLISVALTP